MIGDEDDDSQLNLPQMMKMIQNVKTLPHQNKDIINLLDVLQKALQHRSDSLFFNQHYTCMNVKS